MSDKLVSPDGLPFYRREEKRKKKFFLDHLSKPRVGASNDIISIVIDGGNGWTGVVARVGEAGR